MRLAPLALAAALAACATTSPTTRPARPVPIPRIQATAGLDRVLGKTARELTAAFGTPDADVTEGSARKLQFGSRICVLDAYLYPPSNGRGEPVVTYLDTRQRDGSGIDRASCVAALNRRDGGR